MLREVCNESREGTSKRIDGAMGGHALHERMRNACGLGGTLGKRMDTRLAWERESSKLVAGE